MLIPRPAPWRFELSSAATTAAPISIHLLPPLRRSEGSRLGTGCKGGDCDQRGDQTQRNVPHDLPHFAFGTRSGNVPGTTASALRRSPDISRWQLFRRVTAGRPGRAALLSHTVFPCQDVTSSEVAGPPGRRPGTAYVTTDLAHDVGLTLSPGGARDRKPRGRYCLTRLPTANRSLTWAVVASVLRPSFSAKVPITRIVVPRQSPPARKQL